MLSEKGAINQRAEALAKAIEDAGGVEAMMVNHEARLGNTIFDGDAQWWIAEDFTDRCILSTRGKIVRIIAIEAKRPGTGAFRRLIIRICKSGLTPVVVAPLGLMEFIMKRWGWGQQIIGSGDARIVQYRPTKKWMGHV